MTKYTCPKDHTGPMVFPDGCATAWVDNRPGVTSVVFPDGCTYAWVRNCPGVTSVVFPDGCADAWVDNCPGAKITRRKGEL